MEWQTVSTIVTTSDYIYTPAVTGTLFKFQHSSNSLMLPNLKVIVRQAFDDGTEIHLFDHRVINPRFGKSVLLLNKPRELLSRMIAVKRADDFLDQPWEIEIQTLVNNAVIDMPSYPSSPIYNGTASNASSSNVAVDSTKSVTLSAAATGKVGSTITNKSKTLLYISVGAPASLTVYDKILSPNEVFETPYNWSGDIFGIWDKPDTTGSARVRDFS